MTTPSPPVRCLARWRRGDRWVRVWAGGWPTATQVPMPTAIPRATPAARSPATATVATTGRCGAIGGRWPGRAGNPRNRLSRGAAGAPWPRVCAMSLFASFVVLSWEQTYGRGLGDAIPRTRWHVLEPDGTLSRHFHCPVDGFRCTEIVRQPVRLGGFPVGDCCFGGGNPRPPARVCNVCPRRVLARAAGARLRVKCRGSPLTVRASGMGDAFQRFAEGKEMDCSGRGSGRLRCGHGRHWIIDRQVGLLPVPRWRACPECSGGARWKSAEVGGGQLAVKPPLGHQAASFISSSGFRCR